MKEMINKEIKLAASPLTFFFLAFALLTFTPGYPILCAAFFTSLGLFYSFQNAREANDVLYTALLPVKKSDSVKSKYIFVIFIELISTLLISIITIIRMTAMANADFYLSNALMNANLTSIGFTLLIYMLFNLVFVNGFFKTAYKFGKAFILYTVVCFIVIGIGEALWHVPGLSIINSSSVNMYQVIILLIGIVLYILGTLIAIKKSKKSFELIDL